MFRKPVFWIVFAALSTGAVIFSAVNFSRAFPLVSIDVKMDRDGALAAARELSRRFGWPPADFREAVAFAGDQEAQNFIELEGGGKKELTRILSQHLFAPYTWEVRHYRESDTHETRIRFTPEGQPYGFRIKLPEQEAGAAIEREAARAIAEREVASGWALDLSLYDLVEASQETRPGGREDHTFVYERRDERVGEGRYRIRLVVGGDRLTELTRFIQVPEAFTRRYQEMRAANDTISAFASVSLFVVYILGCCGIGLFMLMRQRWLIWKPAAIWALVICLLVGLDVFNSWPALWMNYDTALPASGFALREIMSALANFAIMAVLLGISFMAAETLSRRAFPNHVQFWKLWSPEVASSKAVLARLTGGYLLVGLFFAYEVVLYTFGQDRLGWWTPSDTLVNPNLFGAYVPSLSAVANSLQAGFWEESLFRAVPLACAALIGEKLGARRTLIVIAMVVQALVFGSGHAGYANQPAYARVVELIIPSFAFGGLYLAFGLLPGIILHYTFDLVWFAMPIFMSSAPRARVEQVILVLMALVPLGITFVARARTGRWTHLSGEALNRAWTPGTVEAAPPAEEPVVHAPAGIPTAVARALPIAGALGLVVWFVASDFRSDAPPLTLSRSQAEQAARDALASRGVQLGASWRVLSRTEAQPGEAHRFVWRTAGADKYSGLLGTYLPNPSWIVRFARFEGDVAMRAEEYQVAIDPGSVGPGAQPLRIRHQLPEAAPGASLSEDDARRITRSTALTRFKVPEENLKEISAEAEKRPMRRDWTFQFSDSRDYGLKQGQARISVELAGDQVVAAPRYVFVPEEWSRAERARRNLPEVLGVGATVVLGAFVGVGVIMAIVNWSRKRKFSVRSFLIFFGALFLLSALTLLNGWPMTAFQFQTSQPFALQAAIVGAVTLAAALILATAMGLVGGSVMGSVRKEQTTSLRQCVVLGVSLGAVMAGVATTGEAVARSGDPNWLGYDGIAALFPFVSAAFGPLNGFIVRTLILAVLLQQIGGFSALWNRRRTAALAMLFLMGLSGTGAFGNTQSLTSWLLAGTLNGFFLAAAYVLVLRHESAIIPIAIGTVSILSVLRAGVARSYPAALPGAIVGAVLLGLVAWVWARAALGTTDFIRPESSNYPVDM